MSADEEFTAIGRLVTDAAEAKKKAVLLQSEAQAAQKAMNHAASIVHQIVCETATTMVTHGAPLEDQLRKSLALCLLRKKCFPCVLNYAPREHGFSIYRSASPGLDSKSNPRRPRPKAQPSRLGFSVFGMLGMAA